MLSSRYYILSHSRISSNYHIVNTIPVIFSSLQCCRQCINVDVSWTFFLLDLFIWHIESCALAVLLSKRKFNNQCRSKRSSPFMASRIETVFRYRTCNARGHPSYLISTDFDEGALLASSLLDTWKIPIKRNKSIFSIELTSFRFVNIRYAFATNLDLTCYFTLS